MITFKQAILTLAMISPMAVAAATSDDITRIRQLLPAGRDIAQVQTILLRGGSDAEAMETAKNNYVIRDINGDGINDLLVISEEQPRFESGFFVFGKRSLHFFVGQRDGSMKLVFTNDKMILGADDGGIFGDPLNGLTVRKNGTITASVYGGSAWRWSYTDTFQFRSGQLYVIGQDSYAGWTGDLRADTVSHNLLTGLVIKTHQKNGDAPVTEEKYLVAVKPLVRVADYSGQLN